MNWRMTMMTPTPWFKTATWWFTAAALLVTGMLTLKFFPSDSIGEKMLLLANFVLGGLGFGASRMDVKKAWNTPSPVQQEEAKPSEREVQDG
jgi:hypothetical protein